MKVLVVGGAGYIGSHVVRELLDGKHDAAVFDNLSTGRRENLVPEARFFEGDILDPGSLRPVVGEGWDAIVHLAALKAAGESMEAPGRYAVSNISGTIALLNAAVDAGVGAIVFSSSAAVYGEPRYLPVDEAHPLAPTNFYGFTKVAIEDLLRWYDRLKGLRHVALRYFNAAGYDPAGRVRGLERNPANLLPILMEVATGARPRVEIFGRDYDTPDGTCVRDYVHVTDLATAHVRALEHLGSGGGSCALNLGSGSGASVLEMLEAARRVTGRPIPAIDAPRRAGDPAALVASSEAARRLLGWEARWSLAESLVATTWAVYGAHAAPGPGAR
jgi:UDP-glucose 4-epimerase